MTTERKMKYPVVYEPRTTYTDSYRKYENLKRSENTIARERFEPAEKPKPPPKVRDNETLYYFRQESNVPFNLLWENKQTNPYECFKMPEKPVDTEKEEVIRTRPRLYMSPAVSIDDVTDQETRNLLLGHMYTTDWRKAEMEAAGPVTKRDVPNSTLELYNKKVSFQPNIFPEVSSEVQENCRKWDLKQTRACVNPTRTFWLNKEPRVKCGACENPYKGLVAAEVKQKIAGLIEKDELRMPHDRLGSTYTGYKPELATGVTLEKYDLPISHPLVSVAQALDKRRQGK